MKGLGQLQVESVKAQFTRRLIFVRSKSKVNVQFDHVIPHEIQDGRQ